MRKLVSVLVSGALIVASFTLPSTAVTASAGNITSSAAVAVTVAKKKVKTAKIVSGKTTVKRFNGYDPSIQTITLPVLENSTSKNRKAFKSHANVLVESMQWKFNRATYGECKNSDTATFDASPAYSNVYKQRYASVSIEFDMYACGATLSSEVKSFTLDLKTGKTVGIGRFVDQDDITTKVAIAHRFQYDPKLELCASPMIPSAKPGRSGHIPRPTAWVVSSKGIRFHFAKYAIGTSDCGLPSGILPWNHVATAKEMTGPVKNRIYVSQLKYNAKTKESRGWIEAISVQGRKVTMFETYAGERLSRSGCSQGIRTGKAVWVGQIAGAGEMPYKFKLTGASTNPKKHYDAFGKAQGWHEATAKDLKLIKKITGSKVTARKICGA